MPTYKERIARISSYTDKEVCEHIHQLTKYLKDDNPDVRQSVIEKLTNCNENKIFNFDLLEKTAPLACDRDTNVRMSFAMMLPRFKSISNADKEKLFDKNSLGLFIYAIEDEMIAVKKRFIKAMEFFLIPDAVTFLIDMLNEDSEKIRMVVSKVLMKATKIKSEEGLVIKCTNAQLKFITLCLEESNSVIQRNILTVLANLYQDSANLFFHILNNRMVDEKLKYRKLLRMVDNNAPFFIGYINKNLDYTFENDKTINDENYFGNLMILKALIRNNKEMKKIVSRKIKEDLKFLNFKLKPIRGDNLHISRIDGNLVKESKFNIDKICKMVEFEVVDGVLQIHHEDGMDLATFIDGNYTSRKTSERTSEIFAPHGNVAQVAFDELLQLFYAIDFKESIKHVECLYYMIGGPGSIKRYSGRPLIFDLNIYYNEKCTSRLFKELVVVLSDGKNTISYLPSKSLNIVIETDVEKLEAFMAIYISGYMIKLSQSVEIAVHK